MRLVGDIALDAEVRAIASGAITDGAPVLVNTDATVSNIAGETFSTTNLGSGDSFIRTAMTFDSNSNRIVIAYGDGANSQYGTAVVASVSGGNISFGTPVVFNSAKTGSNVNGITITFDSNSNKVVIAYRDNGNSNYGTAIVGTVDNSDNSISFGSEAVFESALAYHLSSTFDTNSNKVVVSYRGANDDGFGVVGTVSGTSISFGTATEFSGNNDVTNTAATFDSSNNKVVIAYTDAGNSNIGTAVVGTVSGTSISFGSVATFSGSNDATFNGITFDTNSNKVVIAYRDESASNVGKAIVGTVSGTSISFGTAVTFRNADSTHMLNSVVFDSSNNKIVIAYYQSDHAEVVLGTVSGTSISFATHADTGTGDRNSAAYDTTNNKVVIAGRKDALAKVVVRSPAISLTSENFIGFAHAAYADGQKATVKTTGSIARNIPQQPIASSAGTPVAFDSGRANETSIVYDPNVNRFFIAYKARDNSSYGTGVVATLSGTTLSFGTPVVFESAEAKGITPVFDTNTNKIVITYKDVGNSERGTAIVATIDSSDNSVTYGSAVVYHTSESSGSFRSAAFVPATVTNSDDSANSIVVAFKDGGDSGKGKAVVGVVSGVGNTSTTWGTVATFNSGSTDQDLTVVNDTNAKRLLIAYRDNGNSNYGTAVVATVNSSDSSITFGSETVFHSAETDELCGVFDPDTNKIILCFHDGADGNKSKSIVATISGTSVSFGSVVTVNTGGSYQNSVVYDTTANKAIVSMRDDTNSRGISFTGTVSGTDISYDSGVVFQGSTGGALDFVASAFDPDTSKVAIVYNLTTGKGVVHSPLADGDLTIGQQYFVQTDGSLGTSADSPSVIAGTAIGASELIVKG